MSTLTQAANVLMQALKSIFWLGIAVPFCWIAPLLATYDAMRGDRGSFFQCQRREWANWWSVYIDKTRGAP